MQRDPIKISWEELDSDKVTAKLQRLDAVNKAREHYDKPVVTHALTAKPRFAFLYNTLVYMTLFGALGGLFGWGFGEIMNFRADPRIEAQKLIDAYQQIQQLVATGQVPAEQGQRSLKVMRKNEVDNDYFMIATDDSLSADQKQARTNEVANQDQWKDFIANVLFFGISGMMISTALAAAESIVSRNTRGAILNASVGAALGLIGGVVIALCINRFYSLMVGELDAGVSFTREVLVRSITWGVLGLFIAIAPGILMRNPKRLMIGMIGGLIGGLIGGALYDPIMSALPQQFAEHVARLVAIVTIGLAAGLFTGLLENAVKSGWVKVEQGLIAGKQFVLYRNPTYIGSAPNCHVYLFKDPKVGRRHAAVHVVPGGFELEDLPLGERTRVNDKPITRARLKNGDKIKVGATLFEFHEKAKKQG